MSTKLPYESTTAGEKALGETQKILRAFGCTKFGSMVDDGAGELLVQFVYRDRPVSVKASTKGYAAAWLRQNPPKVFKADVERGTDIEKRRQQEAKAMDIASRAVYSILRDWIKGQVTAIETGVLSFEGAFLGQMLLGNGQTVLEHVHSTRLLPAIEGPK